MELKIFPIKGTLHIRGRLAGGNLRPWWMDVGFLVIGLVLKCCMREMYN